MIHKFTNIVVTFARHLVDKAISGTPMNCALTSTLEGEVLNLRATLNTNQNTKLIADQKKKKNQKSEAFTIRTS